MCAQVACSNIYPISRKTDYRPGELKSRFAPRPDTVVQPLVVAVWVIDI